MSLESLGECFVDFACYVCGNGSVDGFHSFWKTWHVRELDEVGSNGATAAGVTVDGALKNGGVRWCGDYGGIHAMHGEDPSYVYNR